MKEDFSVPGSLGLRAGGIGQRKEGWQRAIGGAGFVTSHGNCEVQGRWDRHTICETKIFTCLREILYTNANCIQKDFFVVGRMDDG